MSPIPKVPVVATIPVVLDILDSTFPSASKARRFDVIASVAITRLFGIPVGSLLHTLTLYLLHAHFVHGVVVGMGVETVVETIDPLCVVAVLAMSPGNWVLFWSSFRAIVQSWLV